VQARIVQTEQDIPCNQQPGNRLTFAPTEMFAWLTVEVKVLTFAWALPW